MPHPEAALHMIAQVGALQAIASAEGVQVDYVKPHGALYNCMMDDRGLMAELMTMLAQSRFDVPLMILGTADHEEHAEMASEIGVKLLFEAFADRRYTPEGRLQSRAIDGSVYHESQQILDQAERIIGDGSIITSDGSIIRIPIDALCVHGDNEESIKTVKDFREISLVCIDDVNGKHKKSGRWLIYHHPNFRQKCYWTVNRIEKGDVFGRGIGHSHRLRYLDTNIDFSA